MQRLDESNFMIYAAKHYENVYYDTTEFYDDLKRFVYIKRLFNHYQNKGELKETLILNHIIVLYNVFGPNATEMLFLKLEGQEVLLKTFLTYLKRMPERVPNIGIKNRTIINKEIPIDQEILRKLEKL